MFKSVHLQISVENLCNFVMCQVIFCEIPFSFLEKTFTVLDTDNTNKTLLTFIYFYDYD